VNLPLRRAALAGSTASVARVLEVRDLTKRFGANVAVDGLSFKASPGRVLGFLGPNGAGKTTTLRTLLGLTLPTSGTAMVDSQPYRALEDPVKVVGAVLEGPQFHPGRTGRNHLRVLATAAGLPASRVDEMLSLVELDGAGRRRVKGYSLGMRQRLSLAGALLGDPRALVLDEPANGLDPQGIRWLRDFLRAQAADGRTVLVSSHVLAEMAQTVDEVVVISRGKLVAQGSLDELTHGVEAPVWVRSPEPERLQAALAARDGVHAQPAEAGGGWLAVRGASLEDVGTTAAENGIPVFELYRPRQSLENVFLELTSGTEAGR
jgi:ABC-2 type transport system ATP-binding protein